MSTQSAVVVQRLGVATVISGRRIPVPTDDEVLVRVKAVAINPTDWKALSKPTDGCVMGVDYAGVVEKVSDGSVTKRWQKGDRIAGTLHGSNPEVPDIGAFTEWTVGRTGIALRIPDSLSFEEGATLGAGLVSAGQGLYQQLGLPFPKQPTTFESSILIYGASSATGTLAVQLSKLSGLRVLATCSPRNFELVKSRGADLIFDYSAPDAIDAIKHATNDCLDLVLDCIGEGGSPAFCYKAIGKAGGKYCSLLFPVDPPRKDIITSMVFAYTAYGQSFNKFGKHFPAKPEDYAFASNFLEVCEGLLAQGNLKPHPNAHRPGGLEGVIQGLEELKSGKVSGEKLTFTISD